nr:hypothetical protein [Brucella intermedia]
MPSKELIAQAAKAMEERRKELIAQPLSRIYPQLAKAAISTIRAAIAEPSEAMVLAASDQVRIKAIWRAMLAKSALGEQSE